MAGPIADFLLSVAEIKFRGQAAGQGGDAKEIEQVYYFRRTSTANPLNEAHIEARFNTVVASKILLALNLRFAQTQTDVRMIEDAERVTVSVPEAGIGAVTGDSMPVKNSVFLLQRSSIRGKFARGGKHIVPLSESDTTLGTADILNAAAVSRMQDIAAAVVAGFTDSDGNVWVNCIFSKSKSQIKVNPTTVVTYDVTQMLVNKRVSSQKKHSIKSVYA